MGRSGGGMWFVVGIILIVLGLLIQSGLFKLLLEIIGWILVIIGIIAIIMAVVSMFSGRGRDRF